MNMRWLNDDDYTTLKKWWEDNRFTPPPKDCLPENGSGGIMVSNQDGIDVCAGFLYFTNSKIAWLEFVVADFNYREDDRNSLIIYLIECLKETAKSSGFNHIFTSVKSKSLMEKYESCGFTKGDKNTHEMIVNLWQQ
jgi:hypothetical protein